MSFPDIRINLGLVEAETDYQHKHGATLQSSIFEFTLMNSETSNTKWQV